MFQSDKSTQVIYYLVSQIIYFGTLVKVCGKWALTLFSFLLGKCLILSLLRYSEQNKDYDLAT